MDERIQKWLYDIKFSIEEIESFFEGKELKFEDFQSNLLLKRAVERDLEIIGEAVNRIIKKDSTINIENAQKIVGLRNHIIHSYDNISYESLWAIIINHLPKLKQEITDLID